MPRHRPVDYPQVHRPTIQPDLGLAPPQHKFGDDDAHNRFSWQVAAEEERLETGERRVSRLPPLPVLPRHLEEPVLPSQKSGQFQSKRQFRPDIPRHLQDTASVPAADIHGPTPTYEASQAAYRESEMQDYSLHTVNQHAQIPASYAIPVQHPPEHQQTSREEKPEQPKSLIIGPDINPLSPASPQSIVTTNIQTFPPPRATTMHFDQPMSATQATHSSRGGMWQHGLFSCVEPGICLPSLVCPCVVYGRTQYRLSLKSARKDPTNMLGFSALNGSCIAWSLLCGVNVLLTSVQRTRVRKAYEMDEMAGGVLSDCVRSCFCCCCVIAQDEKEMRYREKGAQGYQRTEVMKFAIPD
jgi:Cys-rich protein (TIGR01571 family)